jgi:hypothetical protein
VPQDAAPSIGQPGESPAAARSQLPVLHVPVLPQAVVTGHVVPQQMLPTQMPLVQSVPVPQLAPLALVGVQPLALQVCGEQEMGVCTHEPVPLHVPTGVNVAVVGLQDAAAPQLVPLVALSQLPVLHVPVFPQVVVTPHVVPQQMLPTQMPLVHSAPVPQPEPLALVVQPLALHVLGEQEMGVCTHEPVPLHAPAGVNVAVVALHEAAVPQLLPLTARSQLPVLQVPVLPQVVVTGHVVPQQMLPRQMPLVQSVPVPQLAPLALVAVQPLVLQVCGAQETGVCVHIPVPLHVAAGVNVAVAVLQEAPAPQLVPLAICVQLPVVVLHVPVFPQTPFGPHVLLQQTPMTQFVFWH